jgi:glucosamine 6-phosphate synthetase-like amidotransferase/phosphosugar isomerase protein
MCGIFGLVANSSSKLSFDKTNEIVNKLFILSESRGKESAGIAIQNKTENKIQVLKHSVPASQLIESNEYKSFFKKSISSAFSNQSLSWCTTASLPM